MTIRVWLVCFLALLWPVLSRGQTLANGFNLSGLEYKGPDLESVARSESFADIRKAGFGLIRLPVGWSSHVGPAPDYTIEPAFFARVDEAVQAANANGQQIILDYHNDLALMDNPAANRARFMATWKQIAEHYRDAPPSVMFELLNEPCRKFNDIIWSSFILEGLQIIRQTNPTRQVVIGGADASSIQSLARLHLPANDPHLIGTFHFYLPMKFTHQGAPWIDHSKTWLGTPWGSQKEKDEMRATLLNAAKWSRQNNRPILLGEFGAISQADPESRARWAYYMAHTAHEAGIAFTWWEFDREFGVYDPKTKLWRVSIVNALQEAQM
jgi:endoglucanase